MGALLCSRRMLGMHVRLSYSMENSIENVYDMAHHRVPGTDLSPPRTPTPRPNLRCGGGRSHNGRVSPDDPRSASGI